MFMRDSLKPGAGSKLFDGSDNPHDKVRVDADQVHVSPIERLSYDAQFSMSYQPTRLLGKPRTRLVEQLNTIFSDGRGNRVNEPDR